MCHFLLFRPQNYRIIKSTLIIKIFPQCFSNSISVFLLHKISYLLQIIYFACRPLPSLYYIMSWAFICTELESKTHVAVLVTANEAILALHWFSTYFHCCFSIKARSFYYKLSAFKWTNKSRLNTSLHNFKIPADMF